jgi:plastocyanin domain-containing protein
MLSKLNQKIFIGSIASLGLLIGGVSEKAVAQNTHSMPHTENMQATEFQRLEQPLWVKGAVTVAGLGLIGLNIWWFLLSKPKSQNAETHLDSLVD